MNRHELAQALNTLQQSESLGKPVLGRNALGVCYSDFNEGSWCATVISARHPLFPYYIFYCLWVKYLYCLISLLFKSTNMIFSISTIIADILCFLLILIAVMWLLHLIEKYCKIDLPKWLKWNKTRTIISIVVAILIIAFIVMKLVFSYHVADIIDDI